MKFDVKIIIVLALAMLMLMGTLPSTASAAPAEGTWDGGAAIQRSLRNGGDPHVAQSANGNKMAVWTETNETYDSLICYSMFTPETGWSWPEVLDSAIWGDYVAAAQVGMSDNGSAVVSWLKSTTEQHLLSRTFTPGIGWSDIFDHGITSSYGWRAYRLAVNGNGEALLAHQSSNSTANGIEIWTCSTGIGWEAEVLQSVPKNESFFATHLTLSESGRAAASWLYTNSTSHVMVSTRTMAGVWAAPTEIDEVAFTFSIWVGVDDSTGEFMATWLKYISPYTSTYYSVTVGGVWSTPQPVAGINNTYAWESKMVMNSEGKAMVVTTDQVGPIWLVNATMYDDGTWTPMITLEDNTTGMFYPELAIDELGRAVVTWSPIESGRLAATYTPETGWSEVVSVGSNTVGSTYSVGSLSLELGSVLVGYYAYNSVNTIWVSTLSFPDTAPPVLQVDQASTATDRPLFEITGTTEPGATVDVNGRSAAVTTSGEFSVLVELDDGANVLLVTARDEAGNSANASLTVTYNDPVPGLKDTIDDQQGALDQLQDDLDAANEEIASVGSTAMIMGILGIVGLVVAVVALVLVFLRRKG